MLVSGATDSISVQGLDLRRINTQYNAFAVYLAPDTSAYALDFDGVVIDSVSNGIYFDTQPGDSIRLAFATTPSFANVQYNVMGRSGLGTVPAFDNYQASQPVYHLADVKWQSTGGQQTRFLFRDLRSTYDWMQIVGSTTDLSMDSATCTNPDSSTWYLHPSMRNAQTLPKLAPSDTLFLLNGDHRKGSFPTFLSIDALTALITGDTIGQTTIDARLYTTGIDVNADGTRLRNLRIFGAETNGLLIDSVAQVVVRDCIVEESKVPPIAGSQQLRIANASSVLIDGLEVLNYYDHLPVVHAGCDSIWLRNLRLVPTVTAKEQFGLLLTTDTLDGYPGGNLASIRLGGDWDYTGPYSAIGFHDGPADTIALAVESDMTLSAPTFRRVMRKGEGRVAGWNALATQLDFGVQLSKVFTDTARAQRQYLINSVEGAYFNLQDFISVGGQSSDFLLKAAPETTPLHYYIIDYPVDSPFVALHNDSATLAVFNVNDTLNWYDASGTSAQEAAVNLTRPAVLTNNGYTVFDTLVLNHAADTSAVLRGIEIREVLRQDNGLLDLQGDNLRLAAGCSVISGSDSSHVLAPRVEQGLSAGDSSSYILPLASQADAHYRPVTLRMLTPFDSSSKVIARQAATDDTLGLPEGVDTLLSDVQWMIDFTALYTSPDTATARFSFHFSDSDSIPDDTALVMLGRYGAYWRALPTTQDTADSAVFHVTTGVFGFNQFQLGRQIEMEPEPDDSLPQDSLPEDTVTTPPVFQTILTPNGDGKNDVFDHPLLDTATAYDLKVFSANGLLVYDRSNSSDRFAGLDNDNNQLSSGTYFYVLELTTPQGSRTVKSYLTLRR